MLHFSFLVLWFIRRKPPPILMPSWACTCPVVTSDTWPHGTGSWTDSANRLGEGGWVRTATSSMEIKLPEAGGVGEGMWQEGGIGASSPLSTWAILSLRMGSEVWPPGFSFLNPPRGPDSWVCSGHGPSSRRFYWAAWLWQDSSYCGASLMAQWANNLPANQETQEMCIRSLGWQDPLEKEMATHSSILPWRIPRTEEPGGLQSMGLQRVGQDWVRSLMTGV